MVESRLADEYGSAHATAMFYNSLAQFEDGDGAALGAFLQLFKANQGAEFGEIAGVDLVRIRLGPNSSHTLVARTELFVDSR